MQLLSIIKTILLCSTSWHGWTVISAMAALIAAIVAIFYTYYTYHLLEANKKTLEKSNKINEFQIYKEISANLSSDDATKLIDLCDEGNLEIDYSNTIPAEGETKIKSGFLNRKLLNPLEDIAVFWESGLIDLKTIDSGFGYKILSIGNCETIMNHVIKARATWPNVFSGFEALYNEIYSKCPEEEKKGYRAKFIKTEEPSE